MPQLSFQFLGTTAGIPTRDRAHTAIYFCYQDRTGYSTLFDCGEGTQRQMLLADINPMKINEIFISHWHGDHCYGLFGLIDSMEFEGRVKPLQIFGPESEKQKKFFEFMTKINGFEIIFTPVLSKGREVSKVFENRDIEISSTPVCHSDPAVAYAFIVKDKRKTDMEKARKRGLPREGMIYKELKAKGEVTVKGKKIRYEDVSKIIKGKKIVYSGDTEVCENLKKLADNSDVLIHECTYFESNLKNVEIYKHATLDDIIAMIKEIEVDKIYLTHISRRHQDSNELEAMIKDYPRIKLAEDFLKVDV